MAASDALPGNLVKTLRRGDSRQWEELFRTKTTDPTTGVVTYTPRDISALTWLSQIRADPDDELMATVECTLVTDGSDGRLRLKLTATEAAKLVPGRVVWDLQGTDADGDVRTYLEGKWKVAGDVSRP